MNKLSARVQRIKPSPTLAVSAKAAALRAEGIDVIGLGSGEPDFDTPEHIREAAKAAIDAGDTHYTAVDGTPALKQAIIDKFRRENQLDYEAGQILVSCGGKQSFFNLCQALLDEGDEVIIPAPYWVSYPDMVLLADGRPVTLFAGRDQNFKITPEQLEAAITDRTRLFVINSPSNPTGVAYSAEELEALAQVLLRHPQVVVATDDMYEHILWKGAFVNILNVCPELYDRTLVLNGVSKAYAMTGWRIGYAAGPAEIIAAMKKVQSQSTSNPASISQAAACAALKGGNDCIGEMITAYESRHDYVIGAINAIPGFAALPADGTFYAFPEVSAAIESLDGVNDDVEFSAWLLEEARVAVVPGSAFGAPGYIRLSYATSMEALRKAVERIADALA